MEITWLGILAIAILILQDMADIVKDLCERSCHFLCISGIGTCVDDQSVCE